MLCRELKQFFRLKKRFERRRTRGSGSWVQKKKLLPVLVNVDAGSRDLTGGFIAEQHPRLGTSINRNGARNQKVDPDVGKDEQPAIRGWIAAKSDLRVRTAEVDTEDAFGHREPSFLDHRLEHDVIVSVFVQHPAWSHDPHLIARSDALHAVVIASAV